MSPDYRVMSEQEALSVLRKNGVSVNEKDIMRGSYGLSVWSAIDCLKNHIGGYRLVN
jgi:hypothetical protein